jgi:hypothetical protein
VVAGDGLVLVVAGEVDVADDAAEPAAALPPQPPAIAAAIAIARSPMDGRASGPVCHGMTGDDTRGGGRRMLAQFLRSIGE